MDLKDLDSEEAVADLWDMIEHLPEWVIPYEAGSAFRMMRKFYKVLGLRMAIDAKSYEALRAFIYKGPET